ncbi:hypothetical protein FHU29_000228 [Hoyosella altamirensis]|uniref:Uncharacterized protein n=1 Tax=Hoyosella altamirensis TaxID=616997 RepID=A0A839RHW5_9ACTN|nr:hypothetical protein [Hoyosella altamirensis]
MGPDIIIADDHPSARAQVVPQPLKRGADLFARCLAATVDSTSMLPALVEGGVRIGDAPCQYRRERMADRRDMPSTHRIDDPVVSKSPDVFRHIGRSPTAVDDLEFDLAAEQAAPSVELMRGEGRQRFARRAKQPGGALKWHNHADAQRGASPGPEESSRRHCHFFPAAGYTHFN